MFSDLQNVPPAVSLLISETAGCNSWAELRKRIRGLLPDLRVQSEAYMISSMQRSSAEANPLQFDIHLHGALDLFSGDGCSDIDCRMTAADRLARSVGLIADSVWITDFLSDRFINFGRSTNIKIDAVIFDLMVLVRLIPLLNAGILKFRPPPLRTCFSCAKKFHAHLESASATLYSQFRNDFKIRNDDQAYVVEIGHCVTPTMVFSRSIADTKRPTKAEFARGWIEQEIQSIAWVAREASQRNGAIFSNSRVGLASLALSEGRMLDRRSLMALDDERSFEIPWVSHLDAAQIVELRQEASKALPAFREMMAKSLSADSEGTPASTQIYDLREQAAEVKSELESKQGHSGRFWKATYGLLGLGLSAYGVSADQIIPGVGGLLPILQLLISHKAGFETDVAKLKTRPGYVLIKAQDILAHSH